MAKIYYFRRKAARKEERESYLRGPERYIYAIAAGSRVKFGIAARVKERFNNINSCCPVDCVLLGALRCNRSMEQMIHLALVDEKAKGEWFERSERAERIIGAIASHNVDALIEIVRETVGISRTA